MSGGGTLKSITVIQIPPHQNPRVHRTNDVEELFMFPG